MISDMVKTRLSRWLQNACDPLDYSNSFRDGVLVRMKNEMLEFSLRMRRVGDFAYGGKSLRIKDINEHLDGGRRMYYVAARYFWANRKAEKPLKGMQRRHVLLCIDVDAKHGETDALEAAQWINGTHLNGVGYVERSRSGSGAHVYFVLHVDCIDGYIEWDALKTDVSRWYQSMASEANSRFSASTESIVYGWPTAVRNCQILKRGHHVSLPRPQTDEEAEAVMGLLAQPIPLSSIKTQHVGETENDATALCISRKRVTEEQAFSVAPDPFLDVEYLGWLRGLSPLQRANEAVTIFARKFNRMPSINEAIAFYESLGLNTGGDVEGRREKRLQEAIDHFSPTFKPLQRAPSSDHLEWVPLLKDLVSDALIETHRPGRQKITHADLAVLTDAMTHTIASRSDGNNPPRLGKVWRAKVFDDKKAHGKHPTGCDAKKGAAMVRILQEAGVFRHVGEAVPHHLCDAWAFGLNHPAHVPLGQQSAEDERDPEERQSEWDAWMAV